jgi:hypothetical protein
MKLSTIDLHRSLYGTPTLMINTTYEFDWNKDSEVGIVTGCGLDGKKLKSVR